jgi:hypothetical protein
MVATRNSNGHLSERTRLQKMADELPVPVPAAFKNIPVPDDLWAYRVIENKSVREVLLRARLVELVQRPGPGHFTKSKPPAYIAKLHPNFDAPSADSASRPVRKQRVTSSAAVTRVPEPIVNELREKWESFYVDSRPENQRRHAQRAQSVDPMAISTRATQLMAEARKKSRTIAVTKTIPSAPSPKPVKVAKQKPRAPVVQATPSVVTLNPDGVEHPEANFVCTTANEAKAVWMSMESDTTGCTLRTAGPVRFEKYSDKFTDADAQKTLSIAKISAKDGSWSGYVLGVDLDGLNTQLAEASVRNAPTPSPTAYPTVWKISSDVTSFNAYHDIDNCKNDQLENSGSMARLKRAHDAGEYDQLNPGDYVKVVQGNVDTDAVVMVAKIDQSGNELTTPGCVPVGYLRGVR